MGRSVFPSDLVHTKRGDAGFTLMEVMLATLILGLVVSMVTLALSGSLRVIEGTREKGDLYFRAQVTLERISEDLESAFLSPDTEFIGAATNQDGSKQVVLQFASLGHVEFAVEENRPGLGLISYTLAPDREKEGQVVLLRSDRLFLPFAGEEPPKPVDFLLCDGLHRLSFVFYDAQGQEFDTWDTRVDEDLEQQENSRRLPAAVSCTLEFVLDPVEETYLSFATKFVLPVGLMQPVSGERNAS